MGWGGPLCLTDWKTDIKSDIYIIQKEFQLQGTLLIDNVSFNKVGDYRFKTKYSPLLCKGNFQPNTRVKENNLTKLGEQISRAAYDFTIFFFFFFPCKKSIIITTIFQNSFNL